MPTVNYLWVVGWEHVATQRAVRNEVYKKGHQSSKGSL